MFVIFLFGWKVVGSEGVGVVLSVMFEEVVRLNFVERMMRLLWEVWCFWWVVMGWVRRLVRWFVFFLWWVMVVWMVGEKVFSGRFFLLFCCLVFCLDEFLLRNLYVVRVRKGIVLVRNKVCGLRWLIGGKKSGREKCWLRWVMWMERWVEKWERESLRLMLMVVVSGLRCWRERVEGWRVLVERLSLRWEEERREREGVV